MLATSPSPAQAQPLMKATGGAPREERACGTTSPSSWRLGAQAARRVTAQDAAATVPATVKTAGHAPIFLASGCDPAKAAT